MQARAQVHFDAALVFVPARFMLEVAQLEIAAQLAIDAPQQIEIERAGDADGVVIGHQHAVAVLYQVRADAAACRRAASARRRSRRNSERASALEIADGAAQEQHQERFDRAAVQPWRAPFHPDKTAPADAPRRHPTNRARSAPKRRPKRRWDSSAGFRLPYSGRWLAADAASSGPLRCPARSPRRAREASWRFRRRDTATGARRRASGRIREDA